MSFLRQFDLSSIGGVLISLGQKAKAASLSVVLASDQPALSVTPPANQTVDVSRVGGSPVALGQAVKAGSLPVTLASDQGSISVSAASASDATIAVVGAAPPASLQQVGGWIYGANKCRALEIDYGNGLVEIDSGHHEIHEGYSFAARDAKQTLAGGTRDILVIVGTGAIHAIPLIEAGLPGEWFLYEAPTTTANGTAIGVYNKMRGAVPVSTTLVYGGPTVTSAGTRIDGGVIGGGGSSSRVGGASNRADEWVLSPGTKYLIRFTAAGNGTDVVLGVNWYSAHDANGGHVL